ncbi:STAS domain-containing protein [Tundrisphaera sp. TA3]|uniref:STAS domain-containing protein n=1 Tax=Tundrisphaera sp. TA3 TaxID=3435775 RepID=UPI003EBFCDAF
MVVNGRIDDGVAILSNFGGLMNDPRHFDAGREVRGLLDQGIRKFVLEMANIREMGDSALGLMVTITRQIRQAGGQIVLAKPARAVVEYIEMMQMDDYWDTAPSVDEAKALLPGAK